MLFLSVSVMQWLLFGCYFSPIWNSEAECFDAWVNGWHPCGSAGMMIASVKRGTCTAYGCIISLLPIFQIQPGSRGVQAASFHSRHVM